MTGRDNGIARAPARGVSVRVNPGGLWNPRSEVPHVRREGQGYRLKTHILL